ncbi:hypothetical protein EJ04DRAFT_563508 [Polyplosphaeria fusca]|uniref:Uncharacterized protein n=1 Tax=Polyplosphaeria fusca TaxID=682080 RepID=A0A9P4R1Z4_9PLEO|nr:hypothetical protein EJ04DRAFT_563508 [Polyplosphaeria fusca]
MSTPASFSTITRTHISTSVTASSTTSSNTTSSSSSVTSEDSLPPALGIPPATSNDGPTTGRSENVFNYYFLFLAIFGLLIAFCLWWVHKRRKRRKELMRLSGQNALARDLDGWINTRRWMHGRWRTNQPAAFVRREEGLNEDGEAPPPYQPKSEITVAQNEELSPQDPESGLTIPLRTLSRDEIETFRPPAYEAGQVPNHTNERPDTAISRLTRPSTADRHDSASTRDLLQRERQRV